MRRAPIILLSGLTVGVIVTAAGIAYAPASSQRAAQPRPTRTVTSTVTSTVTETATQTVTATETVTAPGPTVTVTAPGPTTTVTQTVTATPSSTGTSTTPTPTPTPTTTAPGGFSCNVGFGGVCGPYDYAGVPNGNGFNTYVTDQRVGPQPGTTETVHANNPGDWQVVADDKPYGYTGVQTFPDVQQLFNNWPWLNHNNCDTTRCSDTPLASLPSLKVNYAETSPTSPNSIYEFAPDVWQDNYGSDVMFWVDTKGRCNEGAFGPTVLGHAVLDGQNWTVHRYGGPGAEIIFVLDGAAGTGTCAQQNSGTVNIKAGLEWLVANGFESGPIVLPAINTGWEITSADNQTFTVSSYSINAS